MGDYAAAELHLTRATQLTPTRAAAWWALGTTQREHGLLDDAERNLRHSLTLKDSSNARSALALALMQRGKLADAEQVHLSVPRKRYLDWRSLCVQPVPNRGRNPTRHISEQRCNDDESHRQ